MAGAAAALLDELMGRSRNVLPGKEVQETNWNDPEVCKNYLCGFCPCDLFTNTRADIGVCDKIHDEKMREKYQNSDRVWKMGYEVHFLAELEKLIRSLDRRVSHGKERLRKSAEAKQKQMTGVKEEGGSDKLRQLNAEINSRVTKLEELGQRGEVEGAQALLKEVEALEKDRERERAGLVRDNSKTLAGFELDANDFHEKMELCDVCGSFLVIGDSQSRVDAHLLGKQHLGYARVRAAICDLKTKLEEIRTSEASQTEDTTMRIGSEDQRSRSKSKERRHSDRRSHSRERRRRSSSRNRSRYHKSRSRSRERRRSRSRGRHSSHRSHRDRSQSRNRSHSRDRRSRRKSRSRSQERSKKRRSRSKERKRSRNNSRETRRKRSRSKERDRTRKE